MVVNENTDKLIEFVFDQKHEQEPVELKIGKSKLSIYRVDGELIIFGLDKLGVIISLESD